MRELSKSFEVGKISIGGSFRFLGCEIDDGDEMIELSMWDYLEKIKKVGITGERRHQRVSRTTAQEEIEYRSLSGTLMYLGNAILPQAGMMASCMQQKIGALTVTKLMECNRYVDEIMGLRPYIRYIRARGVCNMKLISMSDASHGADDSVYGQSVSISGLVIKCMGESRQIYHTLGWKSHKQKGSHTIHLGLKSWQRQTWMIAALI